MILNQGSIIISNPSLVFDQYMSGEKIYHNSTMDGDQNLTESVDHSSSLKFVQDSVLMHDQDTLAENDQTIASNFCIPFDISHTSLLDKLTCPHCLKKFEKRYQLKLHMGRVHKLTASGHPFACVYCGATFLKEKLLQTHYEVKHQMEANQTNASVMNENKVPAVPQSDKSRINCIDCNLKFPSLRTLRKHLRLVHKLNVTEEKICFPNLNAFKKWKLDIERRESTYFFNIRGPFKGSNYLQRMYVCHRSGPQQARELEGKRRLKNLIGPRKTGISCTAAMKVNIYQNEVQVEYCLQHYGHGKEMTFVQLTAEEQAAVLGSSFVFKYN
ncbi:unnamed protein product [Larinioides sclopetarius]|uniref:C2H2-type domain-containing protein n=1 Tax=Larinioides sclopetarius TaxID=280406 RepID=A0AAV2AMZ9_9ARAC